MVWFVVAAVVVMVVVVMEVVVVEEEEEKEEMMEKGKFWTWEGAMLKGREGWQLADVSVMSV
jgi:hypothetical protein